MRGLYLLLATACLFPACSKLKDFGRLDSPGITTVEIQNPNQNRFVGPPQNGGIMVYAVRADQPSRRAARFMTSEGETLRWALPNGTYNFFALGYELTDLNSASNKHRCGKAMNVQLVGQLKPVSIDITPAGCNDSADFQLSGSFAGGPYYQANPVLFVGCAGGGGAMSVITNAGGNNVCDGGGWFDNIITGVKHDLNTGKIYVAGTHSTYAGGTVYNLLRLMVDGTLDTTFSLSTSFNTTPNDMLVDSTGKLVVVGGFTSVNGTARNSIVRLNLNGTTDGTFTVGTGFDNAVNKIVMQSDGKLVLVGDFTDYDGNSANGIIRLNTNGTYDATFNSGTGANASVTAVVVQSDDKLILGGAFTSYDGTGSNRIVRTTASGARDGSFGVGTGFSNSVVAMGLDTAGAVWVSGPFTSYNSVGVGNLVRIFSNGTRDSNANIASTGTVANAILPLPDGKVVLGGTFTTYNATTTNFGIIRLNSNFTIDSTFNSGGAGTASATGPLSISRDANGYFVLGGTFTTYNGKAFGYITRLNTEGSIETHFGSSRPQSSSHVAGIKLALVDYDLLNPNGQLASTPTPRIQSPCINIATQGAQTTTDVRIPSGTAGNNIFAVQLRTYDTGGCTTPTYEAHYSFLSGKSGLYAGTGSHLLKNILPSPSTISFSAGLFQTIFDANYHWMFVREIAP